MTREEQIVEAGKTAAEGKEFSVLVNKQRRTMSAYEIGFIEIEGAEWADSHPQWIPVEERLPKFDEQVLVYGLCPNGCRLFYVDCLIQDINDNGYPKWDDDTFIPTHWMPLPTPPAKKGGER